MPANRREAVLSTPTRSLDLMTEPQTDVGLPARKLTDGLGARPVSRSTHTAARSLIGTEHGVPRDLEPGSPVRATETNGDMSPPQTVGRASAQVPMRVAIADDHRLMLDGIKRALETAPDIKVVGEAMTGEDLVALVPRVRPDVVILDMRMPKGDGLATLQALQKSHPDLKVIMLSMFDDPEHIEKALGYGAAGYVVKSINPLDLPSTIRGVFEGTVYHPRGAGGRPATPTRPRRRRPAV